MNSEEDYLKVQLAQAETDLGYYSKKADEKRRLIENIKAKLNSLSQLPPEDA